MINGDELRAYVKVETKIRENKKARSEYDYIKDDEISVDSAIKEFVDSKTKEFKGQVSKGDCKGDIFTFRLPRIQGEKKSTIKKKLVEHLNKSGLLCFIINNKAYVPILRQSVVRFTLNVVGNLVLKIAFTIAVIVTVISMVWFYITYECITGELGVSLVSVPLIFVYNFISFMVQYKKQYKNVKNTNNMK